MHRPIVIVPACIRAIGPNPNHAVQLKYIDAVFQGADCMPLILPALGAATDWDAVLSTADGVMLTGAPSNVHPEHFGQAVHNPALPLDRARDATTLPLILAVIERGIPLIAVCRGFQEINVALGGSLLQTVHETPGMMDHREDKTATLDVQYAASHPVSVTSAGKFAKILGSDDAIMVNSLHGQGLGRLASGLIVEACADDGLVEAYSVGDAPGFTMAVQWHPEWKLTENPVSIKLFAAFGAACRQFQKKNR
jgi:putative glutamine amidotransferase